MKTSEIIKALRCTAMVRGDDTPCENCPYYDKQPLPEEYYGELPEDWYSQCNYDRVALDAAERLEELSKPAGGWIDTYDMLPEAGKPVLVAREGGKVEQGIYLDVNGWWKVYGTKVKRVSHWMPLPLPPT